MFAAAAVTWGTGSFLQTIVSWPTEQIMMPFLMAFSDSVGAGAAAYASAGLWFVLGAAIGATICSARARRFVRPPVRALVMVVVASPLLLVFVLMLKVAFMLCGCPTAVPGLASISKDSGLRFPISARLRHSAFYLGRFHGDGTTYAILTVNKADVDGIIRDIQPKEGTSSHYRMVNSRARGLSWWQPDKTRKFVAVDGNFVKVLVDLDDPRVATVYVECFNEVAEEYRQGHSGG
jgi:hypothetical protein